jgi:hypothetical protein
VLQDEGTSVLDAYQFQSEDQVQSYLNGYLSNNSISVSGSCPAADPSAACQQTWSNSDLAADPNQYYIVGSEGSEKALFIWTVPSYDAVFVGILGNFSFPTAAALTWFDQHVESR